MNNYLKPEVCSECGGKCCKHIPGACMPSDFKGMDGARAALASGRYCIDWWEGDPRKGKDVYGRAYFIRPAGKGKEGILEDPTWGGIGCTFLTDKGCAFPPSKRPHECRKLEPVKSGCILHSGGKRRAAIAWLKYDMEKLITDADKEENNDS